MTAQMISIHHQVMSYLPEHRQKLALMVGEYPKEQKIPEDCLSRALNGKAVLLLPWTVCIDTHVSGHSQAETLDNLKSREKSL